MHDDEEREPAGGWTPIEGALKIGTSLPLSGGPAVLFAPLGAGQQAYIDYYNAEFGGIDGQEIEVVIKDDQYQADLTKANVDAVPEGYVRKQTLVNAERYITPELKEYETMILNAEERKAEIETRFIRVVAMSGYCSEENRRAIISAGAETCLAKPFAVDSLKQALGLGLGLGGNEVQQERMRPEVAVLE